MTPLLTTVEVADLLRMSPRFVEEEVRRGRLVGARIGGRLRFTEISVATYVEALSTIAAPAASTRRRRRR